MLIPNSLGQNETVDTDIIIDTDITNSTNSTNSTISTNSTNSTNSTISTISTNETDLTDDSWYDTHWGGDAGNDTFTEPVVPPDTPDEPSGDLCSSSICTSGSIICCIGLALVISKRNGVNHEKYNKEHENEE